MISRKLILWWLSIILIFPFASNTFAQEEEEEEEEVTTEKPMHKTNELSKDFDFVDFGLYIGDSEINI
jgi:predicted secreted protein